MAHTPWEEVRDRRHAEPGVRAGYDAARRAYEASEAAAPEAGGGNDSGVQELADAPRALAG